MQLAPQKIKQFQKMILSWYKKNKRDLPWRRDRDPYHILVSEVMLQQTQVSRVIPKYNEWMKQFPTLESLANASTRDVLLYWSGLGYNRRALFLQKLAEELVKSSREQSDSRSLEISSRLRQVPSGTWLRSNNKILRFTQNDNIFWPTTEKELMKLPGIGKYTAAALLCFAFNKQISVVDTNVRKVILVHFKDVIPDLIRNLDSRFRGNDKEKIVINLIADKLLPKGKAYDWNQALMDYAAAALKNHRVFIPKQSTFKNSDRYYRGQIIKLLTRGKKISLNDLQNRFVALPEDRFKKIVKSLEKDNFIHLKKDSIVLQND